MEQPKDNLKLMLITQAPLWSLFPELCKEAVNDMLYEDLDALEQETDRE